MAQSGFTPIQLYYSTTDSAAPSAGNLANGELAINITDGKLYYKNNAGVVKVLAGTGGTGVVAGSNTQIQFNNNGVFGAAAGLTWDGTTLSANALTVANAVTLSGGTANSVAYLNGSKVLTTGSALTFDASTFLVNAANTSYRGQLSLQGGASDFAQITFYRGATTDTNQVGYVHSLNTAGSSQAMVIGARNGAFLKFDVSDSEKARIDTTGRFLLGIQTGNYALDVGDVSGGNMFRFTRSGVELSSYISGGTPFFGTTSNTVLAFMTNSTERGRFTTGGDFLVGGTAAPYAAANRGYINLNGTSSALYGLSVGGVAAGYLYATSTNLYIGAPTGYNLLFDINGERARLTPAGQLLVGADTYATGFSGLAQIEVSGTNGGIIINSQGTTASDYSRLIFTKLNASGNEGLIRYNTNDYHMSFWTNAGERARITSAGQFIVGGTGAVNSAVITATNSSGSMGMSAYVGNNNNTINTIASGAGSGGGLIIVSGVSFGSGQSFSRIYLAGVKVPGGAGSVFTTAISSVGEAGASFTFADSGGFVTATASGLPSATWTVMWINC